MAWVAIVSEPWLRLGALNYETSKKECRPQRQWAGLRLKIEIAIFSCFVVAFLSGCGEGRLEELRRLESMGLEQARSDFQKLPPHTQVRIVVWELEHRRPSSSRFDYLLDSNGSKVGPVLLAEAARTKKASASMSLCCWSSRSWVDCRLPMMMANSPQPLPAVMNWVGKATVNAGKFV